MARLAARYGPNRVSMPTCTEYDITALSPSEWEVGSHRALGCGQLPYCCVTNSVQVYLCARTTEWCGCEGFVLCNVLLRLPEMESGVQWRCMCDRGWNGILYAIISPYDTVVLHSSQTALPPL